MADNTESQEVKSIQADDDLDNLLDSKYNIDYVHYLSKYYC